MLVLSEIVGQVPSMSPSGSTAMSGPMSSCRASPGSFPEFSNTGDATDDLRFNSRLEFQIFLTLSQKFRFSFKMSTKCNVSV